MNINGFYEKAAKMDMTIYNEEDSETEVRSLQI